MKDDDLGDWPNLPPDEELPQPIAYGAWVLVFIVGLIIAMVGKGLIDAAASWVLGV